MERLDYVKPDRLCDLLWLAILTPIYDLLRDKNPAPFTLMIVTQRFLYFPKIRRRLTSKACSIGICQRISDKFL